jgi:hypothetical protein
MYKPLRSARGCTYSSTVVLFRSTFTVRAYLAAHSLEIVLFVRKMRVTGMGRLLGPGIWHVELFLRQDEACIPVGGTTGDIMGYGRCSSSKQSQQKKAYE